jgi:hypothetical protein
VENKLGDVESPDRPLGLTYLFSQRQKLRPGLPNPHVPTFVISVPTTKPRAFYVGDGPPKPLHQRRPTPGQKRRRGLVGRWSGVDVTTEYPAFHEPDGEEAIPLGMVGRAAKGASRTAVSSLVSIRDTTPCRLQSSSRPYRECGLLGDELDAKSETKHDGLWRFSGPVDCMLSLPIGATKQNAMLVHTCMFLTPSHRILAEGKTDVEHLSVAELLYHFKGSFDGVPDADNPFITQYVPWCIQNPLLAKTSLYISARSLAERGFVDQTSTIRLKVSAIQTLNHHLRSAASITDEALAGVVQFVSIEWFFGEPSVVQAHLTGLRDMVRLRGGFTQTGVGALVTKVALV